MGCCNEYDETYIVIEYMDAQGRFSHAHVPAAEVEYAELDENDPKGEALQHASWLLKGEGSIDAFQMVCERFAEKQRVYKDERRQKNISEAEAEYERDGQLHDAKETLASLRRKHFG